MRSIAAVMSMALTLGLVFMVSVTSWTYAQTVDNEGSAGLISNHGSGQALGKVEFVVNQLLIKYSGNWLAFTTLVSILHSLLN